MEGRGIGVVLISDEDASVIETSSFDTFYSKEESNAFADYVASQKANSIIALVCKDEASEQFTFYFYFY